MKLYQRANSRMCILGCVKWGFCVDSLIGEFDWGVSIGVIHYSNMYGFSDIYVYKVRCVIMQKVE